MRKVKRVAALRWLTRLSAVVILVVNSAVYATTDVTYRPPNPAPENLSRVSYAVALLRLALKASGADYNLKLAPGLSLQGRTLKEVEQHHDVDVTWAMTSTEREQMLLPIRIPIFKGLFGWRIPLIRAHDAPKFARIRTLGELADFTCGQGHDWPDTRILASNGIPVFRSPSYEGLFKMLASGRIDFFPRSLIEIWEESRRHQHMNLIPAPNILLQYPAPVYYFVGRNSTTLAEDIHRGLEKIIANGHFNELFYRYNKAFIEQADLQNRTIIPLDNPLLPPQTPLGRKELWYAHL